MMNIEFVTWPEAEFTHIDGPEVPLCGTQPGESWAMQDFPTKPVCPPCASALIVRVNNAQELLVKVADKNGVWGDSAPARRAAERTLAYLAGEQ